MGGMQNAAVDDFTYGSYMTSDGRSVTQGPLLQQRWYWIRRSPARTTIVASPDLPPHAPAAARSESHVYPQQQPRLGTLHLHFLITWIPAGHVARNISLALVQTTLHLCHHLPNDRRRICSLQFLDRRVIRYPPQLAHRPSNIDPRHPMRRRPLRRPPRPKNLPHHRPIDHPPQAAPNARLPLDRRRQTLPSIAGPKT